jgi:uncharacterized membrane protein YoaK (UPF0700 family)
MSPILSLVLGAIFGILITVLLGYWIFGKLAECIPPLRKL